MADQALQVPSQEWSAHPYRWVEPELKLILGMLRRRIWMIVTTTVIVTTIGVVHAFRATPVYEAVAKILIEREGPRVMNFDEVLQLQGSDRDYDKTQQELVKSRAVLEKAVGYPGVKELLEGQAGSEPRSGLSSLPSELKGTFDAALRSVRSEPPRSPGLWEKLRDMVDVEQVRDTHVLLVKVESRNRSWAAKVATAVARSFEAESLARRSKTTVDAFEFVQAQAQAQKKELGKAEDKLEKFSIEEENQVASLDVNERLNAELARLTRLSEQLTEAQLHRIELSAQYQAMTQMREGGGEDLSAGDEGLVSVAAVRTDPTVADIEAELREAEKQEDALLGTYGPEHPLFTAAKASADPLRNRLDKMLLSVAAVRTDPTVTDIRAKLLEAEKQEAALSDAYGPEHPLFTAAKASADLLRRRLDQVLRQIVRAARAQVEVPAKQEEELRKEYEAQKQQALDLARKSAKYGRLQADMAREGKLYDVLVERMGEVRVTNVASDHAKTNVAVVEEAADPKVPVRPRKARIVALSVLLGLFLGGGLAVFFERLDDTVKTPEDLEEKAGVPVLGFVPDVPVADAEAEGMDGFTYRGTLSLVAPKSAVSEAYRAIRTNLFFQVQKAKAGGAMAEEAKTLVVTSGSPGDGKTTTASNLALVIAQSGKRVLLVDADLRKPMLHRLFGLRENGGLRSLLSVRHDEVTLDQVKHVVHHEPKQQWGERKGDPIRGLDVLCAGPRPSASDAAEGPDANPAELLDSQQMEHLLDTVRSEYECVIIDTPPVLFFADAAIVSQKCKSVIVVVKSAKNALSLVRRMKEQLEDVGAKLVGGVLNDVHLATLGYYYSGYYYYGYSGYYSDEDRAEEDQVEEQESAT
jgi:uncharacterized protein involved in exopolysaccharide biosynthesis/Mrp family chromosome partitioning ATPase